MLDATLLIILIVFGILAVGLQYILIPLIFSLILSVFLFFYLKNTNFAKYKFASIIVFLLLFCTLLLLTFTGVIPNLFKIIPKGFENSGFGKWLYGILLGLAAIIGFIIRFIFR